MTTPVVPQLVLDDLQLSFGGVRALDGVSLSVAPGEIVAVVGPNGAGKSSLLNTISGLYVPRSGRIEFEGKSILGLKPHRVARLGIARTFQNIGLFTSQSVIDNLLLVGQAQEVQPVIDMLDLRRECDRSVETLPYGMQKRVELGRALAQRPRLLLLDEPLAGMNRREKVDMARCILEVHRDSGLTVVMIEHDMGLVMEISQRICVLDFGKVIAVGPPSEIRHDPTVVRAYLGTPSEAMSAEHLGDERSHSIGLPHAG
jgi:branched-chain amino acid transport system ATP-binding protein